MTYRILFHPAVEGDLDAIAGWVMDYAGPQAAARRLVEIEDVIGSLKVMPHKGRIRDEIALGWYP